LTLLIECFNDVADPDERPSETKLLEMLSSQIIPSVLSPMKVLFMSGCRALTTLVSTGLISDSSFLKTDSEACIPK
jgi:hypothetical protein